MRVDFNVPFESGAISDDTRIRASLPTINALLEKGLSLVLMSHLGRPKGARSEKYSLAPVAQALQKLLGQPVRMASDSTGDEVEALSSSLRQKEILMLENVRFDPRETQNDQKFAAQLAELADIYVNDAFGSCHRSHASTEGVAHFIPAYAGLLIEKEVRFLEPLLNNAAQPFVAVIGGAKVSTKISVLESLLPKCSTIIIGGGMAYTFLKAKGHAVGKSLYEQKYVKIAEQFLLKAKQGKNQIILPVDHIIAEQVSADAQPIYCETIDISDAYYGLDIGKKTIQAAETILNSAATIIWNGPMGVFEIDQFAQGTVSMAETIAECRGITIVGGGDSVAAVNRFNLADKMDHVSTGGGASLEYLEGNVLPGIAVLQMNMEQQK